MWYCDIAPDDPLHGPYHREEYGFPQTDETVLFERLCLEMLQAGLSWGLILRRRPGFRAVYDDFVVDKVAAYGDADRQRLLTDPRSIRNHRKIDAIIANAQIVQGLRSTGGFHAWLAARHPRNLADWVTEFRATFRFTGPEVVNEFLMSLGWLPGAHRPDCPAYAEIAALNPPWMQVEKG